MNTNKKRRSRLAKVYTVKIREDITKMIERANHFALAERQVTLQTAIEIANRDLRRTVEMHPDRRAFSALKAVSAHIALASNNKYTSASLNNSDLLPVGHPMSTAIHAMTSSALAHAQARWIAADKYIADDTRALVASAYSLTPGSIERRHAFARLSATPNTSVPRMLTLDPLTAAFGFGIGGDSKAARSLRAHLQRRDRYGRFAFMGGGFSFNLRGLDGLFGKLGGRVVGAGGDNAVEIEVKGHPTVTNGIYALPAGKGTSSKAWLPESVDVKDSKSSTDLFIDESSLQRLDAPSGWDRQPTDPGAPELWTSKDGYFVTKDGDSLSLNRANSADNSIGEQIASSDSWADIQKAALDDQDDYEKVLEGADAQGKPSIIKPPRQESTDDGYDAMRDQMLEEGWSKDTGSPGYGQGKSRKKQWSDETSRRAAETDAQRGVDQTWEYKPRDPAKHVGTEGRNEMLIDWARQQSGDFFKSVVGQHKKRGGVLTQSQWNALDKSFVESKDAKTFDGRPKDMTPEDMKQLTDFMEGTKFWIGTTRVYTDGYIDSYNKDSSTADEFFKAINSGEYITTSRWKSFRDYKDSVSSDEIIDDGNAKNIVRISTMTGYTPSIADSPDKDPKKTGQETAVKYVDSGWDSIDKIGPGLAGNDYYLSSAEWSLRTADALNDYVNATPDERVPADNLREAIANIKGGKAIPETPSALAPAELDYTKDIGLQLNKIAMAKGLVKIKYKGKDLVIEPVQTGISQYSGENTLYARDKDGKDVSYLIDEIERPYIAPTPMPEQSRSDLISDIKENIRLSYVEDPSEKYADFLPSLPAGSMEKSSVKQKIAKSNLTEAEKQEIIKWGVTRNGTTPADDTLRPYYESFFEDTISVPEPTAPEAQASDVIDFNPAGKIEDGRKFIADAKANNQKIRFMYNNKERIVSPSDIWVNGQTGRVNLRATDSDGTKKNFSLDKITAPEAAIIPEAAGPSDPFANQREKNPSKFDEYKDIYEGASDREVEVRMALDELYSVPMGRDYEDPTTGERLSSGDLAGLIKKYDSELQDIRAGKSEAPSAPDFIAPEEGRTVLDDGLSKVESALRDIPEEDLDNLDEEDSDALNKVNDLLDSAQEAIDSIDPVGSDTNDLRFDQARADLGEIAQILSESNNGDMQNAGFDLKEKIDEFINLPQIDFGGGRAERASREAPAPDDAGTRNLPTEQDYMDDPAIDGQIKSMDSYLAEEFDSMFETPDGAYKPDIFGTYEPKGKTIEDSADYTDDPEVLAGMFSDQELVIALRDAVLPFDFEDAPGRGALEFSDGPEFVSAEALYWAIDKKSGKGDMSLAVIYDTGLGSDRETTNADRIAMFEEDAKIDPLGGDEITMPTTRDAEVLKAVDRNKEIGKPTKAQVAADLMLNHKEQNQSIIDIADDLTAKQDDGLGYDSFNLQDTLVQYLPWSVSSDSDEREAFSALWGMMMSLDGGASIEEITPESLADPEAFRTIIYNSLLDIHGGDNDIATDSYNELIDNFGGLPEFVTGKESIASGKDDLSSGTTAAAFYRLVSTSAKPNEKSIYRLVNVKNNDPLLEKYTTEGSLFGIDARSFTSTNIADGSLASGLFIPSDADESRVIFEIAPGETKSIDASTISWFVGENEHFSFGNFEVVSVKKQKGRLKNDEYIVKIRSTDTKDVAAPIAEGISYSGIEDWKKVGGQMGSNVGGTYEDKNGNQYYVKIPKSPSHAQNESLASALYREAGIEAVEVSLGFSNGELRTISPLIPNSSTDLQTKLDDAEYMKKLQEGFAVDAWLANWDVAGLTFDNVITDSNGEPVRVDPGGALMWRAQGAPKGKLFGDKVNEIDSLRDPDLNPTSAEVFGSMTDADISNSAAKLVGITPERIDSIVDSIVTDPNEAATLKERLKKRRNDILKRFAPKDNIFNENTPLPIEEDPNAPQPPSDPNDADAMSSYKDALADYEINKAVSDVWDCPPDGLTAAGDKTCTTPSVDELIDNVNSKADAVGVADNSATAEEIIDDVMDFAKQVQDEQLKPSTKKRIKEIAEELAAIRKGLKDGSITNDQAIAQLNTLSDSIPVGGSSEDATTLEVIGESVDDYRRILDGSFENRPFSPTYPPAGSGSKGYAKDKVTFLTIGKRVRNKWGYAGTVDRYDKNSWQVWVTMDIDPSGQFAPGYKKMSFSTKTLDVIPEGGDDSPWIDLPGTPEGKKPKTGVTPTKLPPKGSPGEKYSKEIANKIAKSGKAAKPPKAKAPSGAPKVLELNKIDAIANEISVPDSEQNSTANRIPDDDVLVRLMTAGGSSDEKVDFNTSWAENVSQHTVGDSPADDSIKSMTDFLSSLGETFVDVDNKEVLNQMLQKKIVFARPPDQDHDEEWYDVGGFAQLLHGIAGFTSGRFLSTDSKEEAKDVIKTMQGDKFAAGEGGYANSPAEIVTPKEKSVAEFWTNFAKILDDPGIITDFKQENIDIVTGPAGMLLRALRVADPLEGTYTRVLHFMQDINDESHPLHYILNSENKEIVLRPTSWMHNKENGNITTLDDGEEGIFQYGEFGQVDGALGDVLFTISNPRGVNGRPSPNMYGETEIILSGGQYRVAKIEKKEVEGKPYTHITLEDVTAEQRASQAPENLNNEIGTGALKSETPSTISKAEKATGEYAKENPGSKIYTDSRGGRLWFSVKKGQLGEKRVFIHSVFVDENSRRQGIAADLLDKLANDYFGSQISPGGLTKDGEPFWNWWSSSRGLAELSDPQFPNSRHLMTDEQLEAQSAGKNVDGSNFPYDVISTASDSPIIAVEESEVNAVDIVPEWQTMPPPKSSAATVLQIQALYEKEKFGYNVYEATDEEIAGAAALIEYVGDIYEFLNYRLRAGIIDEEATDIDKLMDKAPLLPEDTVLYRGVHSDYANALIDEKDVGDMFIDLGYSSTSLGESESSKDIAKKFAKWGAGDDGSQVLLEIVAPKGTRGIYVPAYLGASAEHSENEFLLDRGTAFRVISKTKDSDGKTVAIRVAIVAQGLQYDDTAAEQGAPKAPEDLTNEIDTGIPKSETPSTISKAEKVAAIKSAEKNQKKVITHKALMESYKSQGAPAKEFIDAVSAYQSESAGINLTATQMAKPDAEGQEIKYVELVTDITDAINKIEPLSSDVVLYRSASGSVGSMIGSLEEGDEFVNNGFSSTSLDKGKAMFILNVADQSKVLLKMVAPAGTRGAYVDAVKDEKDEFEFLLQRGTKFRVIGKGQENHEYLGKVPVTFVEIVSQDPQPLDLSKTEGTSETSAASEPTVTMKGKVTPTGMPKITVNEPLSFDYTAYEDVPSLRSAIASLSDENTAFAKLRGSSALFDSGDVEDLEVRVEGIVDEQGNEKMRITYKLTSWAGDDLVKRMETEGEWDSQEWIEIPKTGVDPKTGAILIKNSAGAQFNINGTTYTANLGYAEVTLRVGSPHGGKTERGALHNFVTIDLPYNASDDDIKSAMAVGGITDVRPATTTDFTVLAENRLMSIFAGKTDATTNLKQSAAREYTLAEIESEYDVTPADVFVTIGPGGQIETRIPDDVAQKIAQKTGAKYLIHSFSMDGILHMESVNRGVAGKILEKPEIIELLASGVADFLAGPRGGGLMSTRARWLNGVPTSGMSSDSDMGTGGGDYVFFTPKSSIGYVHSGGLGTYGLTEGELMFNAEKLYTRLDWYANYNDDYGRRRAERDVIENARTGAYEVMFKKRVGLESLQSLAVKKEVRDAILTELDKRGIKEIHGRPVAEVVVVAGQPDDPTGDGAAYLKLSNTIGYLNIQGFSYDYMHKYLNSVFDADFVYPPSILKVYAVAPNLERVLTIDEISGVYWYYNADGTRVKLEPSEVQSVVDNFITDTGELKALLASTDKSLDPFKDAIQRFNSGELTAEEFVNTLVALQFSVHAWSALGDLNAYLKNNPTIWELFKKTMKGNK